MYYILSLIRTRLENLGYSVYSTGQRYIFENTEKIVRANELLVQTKKYKFAKFYIKWYNIVKLLIIKL